MPRVPTPEEAVPPGTVLLGKYRVDAILGQGGMGVVAACTHLGLDEKVAIKFLRPDVVADEETCSRFLREAQASVKLKSEHVARVHDVGTLPGGSPYMVMEFLEGVDLDQMLTASGPLDPALAVEFVLQACEALAEAHSLGIVHRDVKPSNFFVTWHADGAPLVKILDFGISKAPLGIDLELTRTQSMLGTPAYMSPEQMRSARSVDARTDLWSLGTVLYELIEGRRPFAAESFSEMCVKVAADPPEPMRAPVPAGLDLVIYRCLEKEPARRYQTIGELADVLAPYTRDPREAAARVSRIRRTLARTPLSMPRQASVPSVLEDLADTEAMPVHVPPPRPAGAAASPRRRAAVIAGVAVACVAAGIAVVFAMGGAAGGSEAAEVVVDAGTGAATATATATATDAGAAAVPDAGADAAAAVAEPAAAAEPAPKKNRPRDRKKPRRRERTKPTPTEDDVFGRRK